MLPPLPEVPDVPDDPGGYVRRIAMLVRDAALALQTVHEQGIVHRDVKPANLMLTPDGSRVVLMDFGLAKGQSLTLSASRAGGFLGTLRYAAPEQLAAASLKVGPAADVRGLGVTLWELLTRRRLFADAEDERQLASLIYERDVPRLRAVDPSLDRDLEAIVARATERRVADRIAAARELADYLQLYLDGKPLPIRPPTAAELVKRWLVAHKPVAAAGIVVLVTTVVAFVLVTVAWARSEAALKKQQQAESDRALEQVDALLSAAPEAIPAIAGSLELDRPEVEARLRELWANPDLTESQRMRVAAALEPIDPAMERYLFSELFGARPAEMLVLLDALQPHWPEFQKTLWENVTGAEANAGQRFRMAVALAKFAPKDPRWADLARLILDPLLSAGPEEQGLWVKALEPVKETLRGPLARVFRDPGQPAKRLTAAQILAVYAADRPDFLADLAADADPDQYAVLLPVLQGRRDEVVTWLGHEMDRLAVPLEPEWQDPLPARSWAAPDPALVQQIERGQGMLTDHFALCQTLPLDQFLAVAEGLRPSGYRPACFRPYPAGKAVQVAGLWVRDGHDWRLAHDATADEVRKQDAGWRAQGFGPEDVAGYPVGAGKDAAGRYAALWVRPGRAGARLYVDRTDAASEQAVKELQTAGLIVRTQTQVELPDGTRRSAVWWKPDRLPDLNQALGGQEEAMYNSMVFPSNPLVDVRLGAAPAVLPPPQRYQSQLNQVQFTLLLRPADVLARSQRAQLNFLLGKDEEAVADLDWVLANVPQSTFAFYWRALARARLGKATEARQDVDAYQKGISDAGWRLALHVAVSAYLGDEAEAVKQLEAALTEHADDPDFQYAAGCACAAAAQALAAKRPDQSRAYADRAVALFRQAAAQGFVNSSFFSYRALQTNWPQEMLADNSGFQELLREGHIDRGFSAVWNDTAERESAEAHGLDPARHLERCRELAAAGYRPAAVSVLWQDPGQPAVTASAWNRPVVPEALQEARARRQAQVAVTLLRLSRPERVWPLLVHRPDPRVRTYLIHSFGSMRVNPRTLVERLENEPDLSARRALILALGQFRDPDVPAEVRDSVAARLLASYREDPDPGLHAAADWLLRARGWGPPARIKELDNSLKGAGPAGKAGAPHWVVNRQGQTMVVLPGPVEFWMGSPAGESDREDNERLHRERIPRAFALGEREVTLADFQRFWVKVHPNEVHAHTNKFSPDPGGPAIDVTWLEAAQYCRWLSEQEDVPKDEMCFPPLDQIKEGMVLPANYLHRTGYRLPTVAEWEYASRAGAETGRYYGGSASLLGGYAYFSANSEDHAWTGGRLQPNDFGLFDVYGNVWEWCQDYRSGISERGSQGQLHEDRESANLVVAWNGERAVRGGSFLDPAARLRSAYHNSDPISHRSRDMGFRLARTVR